MIKRDNDTEEADDEYISTQERNKLLWSLRSDFAWTGKKIPESVEIDGREYKLRDMVRELSEKESLDTDKTAEIRALIPKLNEKSKVDEELIETEELTKAEAEALYEEATGLMRVSMELKDKLEGKGGEKSVDEFKRMLNTQKIVDEKYFQNLIKSLK
ncbi:MAG TPA: DUF5788 family protein [Methanosarcina vacuolata]|uniref:DUF5788 family protein n=1 Tax=Methanosarcina sp. Kolksee TaxID=1434099 RepID=UPI00061613D5|nr:DUF5788 family protein [Methanosarcina sp. Kolksee]AKB45880.1 hypothetical protein MSKOL_0103 [Methanosarcina sp. Kolksee]HNW37690.1 DUF5788 family protein [Methanosarcina vacuolata]HPS88424.1 DUF5788 family protein [Methanosarcina vacuolata]